MTRSTGKIPKRTVEEKLRIVAEYEAAPQGQRAVVARRNQVGLVTIHRWAHARDNDLFGPSATGWQGRGAMTPKRQSAEIIRLRQELAKAQADQEILKAALESSGKAHALLERLAESAETEPLKKQSVARRSPTSSPTD
ncbi:hypothetical protein [Dietzia sp. PP-33]|jgi:transposase|uniref:hypothetical protein n=1 Tax=Dietzia sp. PP-33 TaxID=2957500 RepID=UPI0029B97A56|nr:hypothetical protein [Dietzia sp. PP-33]MDX2359141.1 hypothetical protein [Dietzia sp. PP-33]